MNVELNRGLVASNQGCVTVAALDWAREPACGNESASERTAQRQESDPLHGTWDFIIGADLVYARSAVEPLAKASETNQGTWSGLRV